MRTMSLLLAAAMALALHLPAAATPIADAGITRGEVATYLKSKGYPVNAKKDANGLSILRATTPAGVPFDIYFFDCNDDGRCPAIQFAAGWSMATAVPLDRLNAWNRDQTYIRAYTQQNGSLFGELDMILAPGGTAEQLDPYCTLWNTALARFKTHFQIQ